MNITVCVATIPPRAAKLTRCLASVAEQTMQPSAILVEYDHDHAGAPITKNRALAKVTTEFVAFIDDDDTMWPAHLQLLSACVRNDGADFVYSVPYIPQAPQYTQDPAHHYWVPFDEAELRRESFIQTTILARTDLVKKGGGFWYPPDSQYDDWGLALGVLNNGGKIVHLPVETFTWNHDGGNTSGLPTRW